MAAVGSVNTDRNYESMMNGTNTTGKVYNAVFSNGDDDNLTISDFFDMMILQLTNQDFMNPVDDTQYLAQMAQFATMQEMMDLCQYSKQNYVTAMLGKEVTISNNSIGGGTKQITGVVEKIMLQDGDYKIYVDGKPYDFSKVTQIGEKTVESEETKNPDKTDEENKTGGIANAGEDAIISDEDEMKALLADG